MDANLTVAVSQAVSVSGASPTAITIPARANCRVVLLAVASYPGSQNYNGVLVKETDASGTLLAYLGSETSAGPVRFSGIIKGTLGTALYVAMETPQLNTNRLSVTYQYEHL